MNKKTSQGRKKIEIKKIEKYNNRHVTFSKRRNGLFKKGAELCVLTGSKMAIIVNSPGGRVEFWFDEPIDGMDVAKLEQYIYSLQELKRKVLTRADELSMNNAPAIFCPNMNNNTPLAMHGPTVLQHLKGPETNVLEEPNVLSPHGLNVFDDAWKNNNDQYYFDHALMINANVQGQGSVNYNLCRA
nr:agamous-like MADS-box protein AGL62 [Tanacetum cinerariifolium]